MNWLLLVVACSLFIVTFSAFTSERSNRAWSAAASHFGLEFQRAGFMRQPLLRGRTEGVWLQIEVEHTNGTGYGNRTKYFARHKPVGPSVRLTRQTSGSGLGRMIGRHDVIVGDPFFDASVVVDSPHADAVTAFLNPARRAAVMAVHESWRRWEFERDSVVLARRGVVRNAEELIGAIRFLIDTALTMGDPGVLSAILEQRERGLLGYAAEQMHVHTVDAENPNVLMELIEAGNHLSLGDHGSAGKVLAEIEERLPEQAAVEHYATLAALPPPPPPPPPAPDAVPAMAYVPPPVPAAAAPAAPVPAVADEPEPPAPPVEPEPAAPVLVSEAERRGLAMDQASVIDDLFDAGRMSWELVEYFETTYQNARVRWSGQVDQIARYERDRDFGAGPGLRVRLMVGAVGGSELISSQVHAVLALPPDAPVGTGSTITVQGVLTHVDRFSRNLWIEQAVLVVTP